MIINLKRYRNTAAQLLGIKFFDHFILGSPDCEEGRGYVSVMENFKIVSNKENLYG